MGKPTEASNDDQRLYRTSTTVATMRTYDDTFSGQKIYPGKVRHRHHERPGTRWDMAGAGGDGRESVQ